MEQYKASIEKVWKEVLSTAEKIELLEALTRDEAGWKMQLQQEFEQDVHWGAALLSEQRSAIVLEQLHEKISMMNAAASFTGATAKPGSTKVRKLALATAAAAAILIAFFTWHPAEQKQSTRLSMELYRPVNEYRRLINTNATEQEHTLEDGSRLTLAAGTRIVYVSGFRSTDRSIALDGQAWFDVAKDSKRPFSVTAEGITTTALGTRFMMNSAAGKKVAVQLFEGKVMVHAGNEMKPLFLQPGEQCILDPNRGSVNTRVIPVLADKPVAVTEKTSSLRRIKALEFVQAPLADVLTQLGMRYHVHFIFQADEIGNDQVTGTFLPSDSLPVVLNLLRATNNLGFSQQKDTILVSKPR